MKFSIKYYCLPACLLIASSVFGQYNWQLDKDKNGIKVYLSDSKSSNFKSIKVECTLKGNYTKLLTIITNVSLQKEWVYNNKTSYILKRINPLEYYYYIESSMPWPLSNRDAVVHAKINKDNVNRSFTVNEIGEPNYIPKKSGLVRLPRSTINWFVTTPSDTTVSIIYTLDIDPGGSLPAWLANMFLDKGPYESFTKLAKLLEQ